MGTLSFQTYLFIGEKHIRNKGVKVIHSEENEVNGLLTNNIIKLKSERLPQVFYKGFPN